MMIKQGIDYTFPLYIIIILSSRSFIGLCVHQGRDKVSLFFNKAFNKSLIIIGMSIFNKSLIIIDMSIFNKLLII